MNHAADAGPCRTKVATPAAGAGAVVAFCVLAIVVTSRSGTPFRTDRFLLAWSAAHRCCLGVHWLSDVLDGRLFALAWLGLCRCLAIRYLPAAATTPMTAPLRRYVSDDAPQDSGRRG